MTPIHDGTGANRLGRLAQSRFSRAMVALCMFAATSMAVALQPITPQQNATPKLTHSFIAPEVDVQPELEATTRLAAAPQHAEAAAFLQRNGGTWEMRWDRRSDRPNLVQGSGIALIPGRGNTLRSSEVGVSANDAVDMAVVETRLKDFIEANSDLLKTKGLEFRLDTDSSLAYGEGNSHWFVEFAQFKNGVRVEGANLFFRIAAGNIVQFGANEVADVSIDTQPVSTRENAFQLAFAELAFPAGTTIKELLEAGELLVVPVTPAGEHAGENYFGTAGKGYAHRLAWRFVFRLDGDVTTYQVLLDAHTNRVIEVRDLNDWVNATVSAGIYPTTNTDVEVVRPMPFASVTNAGLKVTDVLGIYDYSGGTATATLNGKYFNMSDNCGAISLSSTTDGNLAFGTSAGTDCVTPGVGGAGNTHASRSGFYHLTNINRKAITFFPSNAWLQGVVTANMNINDQCNAGWNGSTLNFFKSGGGCSNTGEIAAVFLHEWGHGMDTNSGGAASENGSGEAVGDTFAFLETKDACIGKNFIPGQPCANCAATCTGVRDVNAFSTHGAATISTPANVTSNTGINCDRYTCPYLSQGVFPYQGPMGYEGHCESYIASSANWDLSQALVSHFGTNQGWSEMDRIWYGSLTPSKSAYRVVSGGTCNAAAVVDGCGANNWYTVFLASDDNDGNLANGTPNGCRIWDAFSAHGIACGARPVCSADAPDFTLAIVEPSQSICAPGNTTYTINIGAQMGFANPVTLAASGLPAGVSASFSPNPVAPGASSTMTLTANGSAVAGSSTITVNGTATASGGHSATTQLVLTTGAPSAPVLSLPANGATGVNTAPTLSWAAAPNAASYTVEIATDAAFTTIVQTSPSLTTTTYAASGLLPNTAYFWRVKAFNACGNVTSLVFSFTTANMICHAPNVAIPDNNPAGVTDSMVVSDASTLTGLKVIVRATHTWVGDLAFTVSKGASSSIIIDRPGVPAATNGCNGDNIDVTMDDASAVLVENQCNAAPPAISGVDKPNNPINTVFNGQSLAGTWNLKVVDAANQDTGSLVEWCLVPTTGGGPTTFTVGGNVGGLTGSGLVLSLNAGAQTLPVALSGPFTFPTGLANGAAYAVTVGTQPAGQTCSVANGSGTIAGANVTNVAVTCTATPTFTVGGNVSGLAGTGLVLSLNAGAQTLPVGANGTFTFPTGLANGAAYAVTVGTQPSTPSQTCAVTNGSGTIAGANVTNVAVACTTNPPQTYSVGGNVSGLTASGLVLSLNAGAQTLPVAVSGAFTFPTPLADASAYAVTVGTQPAGQTCAVTNGSGTIAGANVTNVAVACTDNPDDTIFEDGFDPAAASCTPTQLLADTSFEASLSGSGPWDSNSTNFGTALCDIGGCGTGGGTATPRTGDVWAWFGGIAAEEIASVTQSVTIPAGGTRFLNFYLFIGSIGDGSTNMDVTVDGTTVASFPEPAVAEAGYSLRSVDVSAYANGASHSVELIYATTGSSSNYSVDDVTLDCSAATPMQPRPATHAPRGPVTYRIH
jgi:subtilisin-like proprotein convertase family protein